MALMRPRAIFAIVQAMGKASSNVNAVARMEMTAVRTKVCQYSGSSMKVRYCSRLASYSRGATRTRSDKMPSSTCGSTSNSSSHNATGASIRSSIKCAWARGVDASGANMFG